MYFRIVALTHLFYFVYLDFEPFELKQIDAHQKLVILNKSS